jgi:hypothetical protein
VPLIGGTHDLGALIPAQEPMPKGTNGQLLPRSRPGDTAPSGSRHHELSPAPLSKDDPRRVVRGECHPMTSPGRSKRQKRRDDL